MVSETKEEKLIKAIFGNDPQPKSLRFTLALEDVVVDVAVRKAKKANEAGSCRCENRCPCGGKS